MTAVACCRRLPGERGVGPHGQPEGATQGSAGPDGGEEDEGGGSARRGGRRRHAEPAVVLAHGGGRGGRQEEEVSARRRAQRLVKALWFPRLYKANKSQSCVTIVFLKFSLARSFEPRFGFSIVRLVRLRLRRTKHGADVGCPSALSGLEDEDEDEDEEQKIVDIPTYQC